MSAGPWPQSYDSIETALDYIAAPLAILPCQLEAVAADDCGELRFYVKFCSPQSPNTSRASRPVTIHASGGIGRATG